MKVIKGLIGLICVVAALFALHHFFFPSSGEIDKVKKEKKAFSGRMPQEKETSRERFHRDRAALRAEKKIAIIIDDIGYQLGPVEELLKVEAPIAFAILPYCPHSLAAAEIIHGAGREVLLHLPMEPLDPAIDPGQGALFRSMEVSEIKQRLASSLEAVPYVTGVNNHMGSAFMEDEAKLSVVLQMLAERGLFFIDSRTTPRSRAGVLAEKIKLRFGARRLFMDNDQDRQTIFNRLMSLGDKKDRDSLIVIGHPYRTTVGALQDALPLLQAQGIAIVPPSELVGISGQ